MSVGIARGSALTLGSNLLARAAGVAQSIVVARLLDPQRVGLFAIVSYVVSLAGAFADLGLPVAAMQLTAEARATRSGAGRAIARVLGGAIATTAALVGLVLVLGADLLADLYGEPALGPLFRLAAVALVASVLGSYLAGVLQGLRRIDVLAAMAPLRATTALAVTLALLPSVGLAGILVGSIAADLAAAGLAARPLARGLAPLAEAAATPPAPAILRRGIGLAVPAFLGGVGLWLGPWLLRSLLAQGRGYADVGLFQVADALSRVLLLVPSAVAVPVVPAVAALDAEAPARLAAVVEATLRATVLIALPAGLFLYLAAGPVLRLVYGAAYLDAAPLLRLLAVAAFLQCGSVIVSAVRVGLGRMWTSLAIQVAGQAVLIALAVALTPSLALSGLGVAHVAAAALSLGLGLGHLRRGLGLALGGVRALLPLAVAAWAGAALLQAAGADGLGAAVAVAGGVALLELTRLRDDERRWLRAAARRAGLGLP